MVNFFDDSIALDLTPAKMKFGERIEFLIEKKGVSRLWIADRLGVTKQALNYLLKHASKPKFIDELAEIMGANPSWIEFGEGVPFNNTKKIINSGFSKLEIHDSLSILSSFKGDESEYQKELMDYSNENIENIVAYKIPNDSVFPPFMENTILIFDKTKSPSNGDYVLIIVDENESVLVRQYSQDGNDIYFLSKNSAYKSLVNIKASIIGVLIEARYKLL